MIILFPDNWMQEIVPFINQDNDFILVGSMSQMDKIPENVDWNKVILYNWDWYSFIDKNNRPDWVRFTKMCQKAREVWMPTHAHSSYFRRDTGIDSQVINLACVLPHEWVGENTDGGYALMSSRMDAYKRFPLFTTACIEAGIPFKISHPATTPREEYIKLIKGCKVYVQASLDESLGGLSLMEAVYNRKPVLMSNSIMGGREIYGDTIQYFQWDNRDEFVMKLRLFQMLPYSQSNAFDRIKNQTPQGVAEQINKRIKQLKND